jgi:hypothetical protein
MDKNDLRLVGKMGGGFKKSNAQNGSEYIWFPLEIESRDTSNSTENNRYQRINIMCFKKHVIDYLTRVKAHTGNRVIVFGFISSYNGEINGKPMIFNGVNANEIYVIKTKE